MTTIERLHAVAPTAGATTPAPLIRLPGDLANPRTMVGVLNSLGLTVPNSLSAAAYKGESLRASGHRYAPNVVDAALSKTNFSLQDRMRLKSAMGHAGIITR
jgi:hypothetical protein